MTRWLGAVLVLCAAWLPQAALAQPADAVSLSGVVRDQTAAPVPGATVTVTGAAGHQDSTATDAQGHFSFAGLADGTYTLTVATDGFATLQRQVRVPSRREGPLQLVLRVGLSLTLDVVPAGPRPSVRRPQATTILTGRDIESLPDDFMRTLQQMAGATRPDDVSIRVNGSSMYRRLPKKNAIEMIRIDANPFSAELSQPGRKQVEIMTKPGSDTLHGGAKVGVRDTALNAKNPLAASNPEMRYVDPDAFLSGPILKDRADFELFGQQSRHDENAVINATVLDPATRLPVSFGTTVATPLRSTMGVLNTGAKVFGELLSASFGNTRSRLRTQGLGGGLELEESAYDVSSQDGGGEFGWTHIGRRAINVVRLQGSRVIATTSPRVAVPGLVVLDAFTGGGNAANSRATTLSIQASESFTVRLGSHTMQVGAQVDHTGLETVDRSGFNGTFTFGAGVERGPDGAPVIDAAGGVTPIAPIENYRRTLLGLAGYGPSQFSVVSGDPQVTVGQSGLAWYALDNWSISKQVWLAYGVRGELQQHVSSRANLAPRVSLSWQLDPEGGNAIEAYSGLFYSRIEPSIQLDVTRLSGTLQQERVIQNPSFFPTVPALEASAPTSLAQHTLSPDVRMPRNLVSQVSYERLLPYGVLGVMSVNLDRGSNLLRSRNTAAPGSAPVFQVESTGRSWQRELTLSLWGSFGRRGSMWGGYTLGKKEGDTDGAYTMPADSTSLAGEYSAAADDLRHRFDLGTKFDLKYGVSVNATLAMQSGAPFNITTGIDNNGDSLFTDRPAYATAGAPGAIATPYGWLNPDVRPGDRIVPRNLGREPWQTVVNLAVGKQVTGHLSVSAQAHNLLNATNLFRFNGVLTAGTFGQSRRAQDGRSVTLSLSLGF